MSIQPVLTIIESPYAGDVERNLRYARRCLLDSIRRGEIPFASHLFYPQVLDDLTPPQRLQGIRLGLAFYSYAARCAVYEDYGVSDGMAYGMEHATRIGVPIIHRTIGPNATNEKTSPEP